jgi:hypothetical protein
VAVRVDAGYFAGELARVAHLEGIAFAIGAKRIAPLWRLLSGIGEDDWTDAIDMDGAQVAVANYRPAWWPSATRLLIRRVHLSPEQVSADPRSRRRRTLHPDQRALPLPELVKVNEIYAYSFILTNLDVSTMDKAVAVEHWYRHRTEVESIFRDSKHGAALRHLPSGDPDVNTAWMWGALLAASIAGPAASAHRHHSRRGQHRRARGPRRQSHERHPAASPHPRPRPARPPHRDTGAPAATRPQPARRDPHPAPSPTSPALTRNSPQSPTPRNRIRTPPTRGDTRATTTRHTRKHSHKDQHQTRKIISVHNSRIRVSRDSRLL